jgi:hypothetical protein
MPRSNHVSKRIPNTGGRLKFCTGPVLDGDTIYRVLMYGRLKKTIF